MNNESYAKECGLRCRRIRQARNMSQQELADKMFTTPQNISKYEKEGISSIDTIKRLSEVLGQDILTEERDVEGTVGEIGKEILFLILLNEGKKDFFELVNFNMYGLSAKDVTNEILKLERIGLCVREQYKDWNGEEADDVFITAKGIITLKNLQNNKDQTKKILDVLPYARSYEIATDQWGNMQEYIENNHVEKLVRSISYDTEYLDDEDETFYRLNYVKYLKEQYTSSLNDLMSCFEVGDYPSEIIKTMLDWIPSRNIYHDILYRMACNLSDQRVFNRFAWTLKGDTLIDFIEERAFILFGEDYFTQKTRKEFYEEFYEDYDDEPIMSKYEYLVQLIRSTLISFLNKMGLDINEDTDLSEVDFGPDSELSKIISEKNEDLTDILESIQDLLELSNAINQEMNNELDINTAYEDNNPYDGVSTPIDWYSKEEIEKFVMENYQPPRTEREKKLEAILKKINEEDPDTLDYYEFPLDWELNGLADLVRERCGIEKRKSQD